MIVTCEECGTEFRRTKGNTTALCSLECRFMAKVDVGFECWNWTGTKDGHGYGHIGFNSKPSLKAHRYSYELLVGPIPEGMQLDHLCRNRLCVNPDHLEPVSNRENTLRGNSPNAIVHRTGVCKRGHSMEDAIITSLGRTCRKCENESQMRRYYAHKEANR